METLTAAQRKARKRASAPRLVLNVNKPTGMTSHDVVSVARRAFGTRAVGHAGTLDPMATGVLVLLVGEGTKLVPYLTSAQKSYLATVRFGVETDSLDADGEVSRVVEFVDRRIERVHEAAAHFLGPHRQRAPRLSAIKVDGVALHRRVRRGEDVTAPIRDVVLRDVEVLSLEADVARMRLTADKGFYVRSFARDVAEQLGTVAHLTALHRTGSGQFVAEEALPFEYLKGAAQGDAEAKERLMSSARSLIDAWSGPTVELTESGVSHARVGKRLCEGDWLSGASLPALGTPSLVHTRTGEVVAVARRVEVLDDGQADSCVLEILRGFQPKVWVSPEPERR